MMHFLHALADAAPGTVSFSGVEIALGVFCVASLGALLGIAASWGALKATVERLEETAKRLEAKVSDLEKTIARIEGRDDAREAAAAETAKHRPLR